MTFSDRLKFYRNKKGLTQQQVADALGIKKATYSGYEIGRREPDVLKIKQLSHILGISGDELLNTGFQPLQDKTIGCEDISSRAQLVAKAYDAQPEMQPAVDRLLGIEQVPAPAEEPYTKIKTAAYGGGVWEQPMTKEEYEKLRKIHELPNDFR